MKRKNRRKLDSCRAVDRGLDPPSTRAAMKPSSSMRVALSNALSRSSSQRAKCGQIGPVGRQRVRGQAALHPHCIEKSLQGGIRGLARSGYRCARGACINRPFQSRRHSFPRVYSHEMVRIRAIRTQYARGPCGSA